MPISDQDHTTSRYTLIPRTLIFLTHQDQILLIKGAPHKRLWANLYNGIGGHVERGEDLLTAAKRELLEETGLTEVELWLCGTITIDTNDNPGIGIFVYRGECMVAELKESKEGTLSWIPLDQVYSVPLVKDLYQLLPRILKTSRNSRNFSALYTYNAYDQLIIRFGD
jgi:8-oxo-dGTP diphosphatase